jgi:UDP-N-acetylmuramoyl-L-alanyl-D-glutamate--2,6-diaminopimelate ligase
MAEPRDIILIAGKGHENYQEFGDHIAPFDDVAVAREALEEKRVESK